MALYAFDGTSECGEGHHGGTNVLRYSRLVAGQAFYVGGVGNPIETDGIGKVIGIAFGYGGQERLREALQHFTQTYQQDQVIDIIGFSRGAALAIEFMHRAVDWARSHQFPNIQFRFVALMDTVFSFGLPNDIDLHYHHDIPHDVPVKACYHAVALHETRSWFPVTCQSDANNVEDFRELGFKGAHADIGGGYMDRSLSNIVLNWFIDGAKRHGVAFNDQLPAGKPYAEEFLSQIPVTWEYFESNPARLPYRENQWYFAQAPRRFDRHIIDEAMSRGLQVCDWQRRIVRDYRQSSSNPRVFKELINLSLYQKQNGEVVDPSTQYEMHKRYRSNGKPVLLAEHVPLNLADNIGYNQPIELKPPSLT